MRTIAFVAVSLVAVSASADPDDKTLSPYFVVEGAQPGVDALPLESTSADIKIAGVIADVTVTQVYKNAGDRAISARYVFPASTRAAVYGMQMTIGARVIVAKIKERETARAEFEEAKRTGKTASLLEQDRPNVFSMNVANIVPKDRIEVQLKYTELLVPTDGTYELAYPTVVGPRYRSTEAVSTPVVAPPPKGTGSPGGSLAYTHQGQAPAYTFGMRVSIAAGMPIQSIASPSHKIVTRMAPASDRATIDVDDPAGGNRDFVLRYQLADKDIASGLLLYPGAKESFFVMMVQPPRRPATEMIPPREYVFIVDVSGSMAGFPLNVSKTLMRDLLGRMRPTDTFNVLLFSGGSELFAETSVAATPQTIRDATAFVDRQSGGGGTELLPALQRAMRLPRGTDVSRSIVVITDGFVSEEAAMFDHIKKNLGEANVFSFGIGSSVNRHLVDGVAKAGQGEAFVVLDEAKAPAIAARFRAYVESPVLAGVKVAFDGFDAYDVEPKVLPDVFAERPVVVFGKYRGTPAGSIKLTGVSGRGRFVSTLDAAAIAPDAGNRALPYLWARAQIAELSDFSLDDANKAAVLALGLEYNLLTRYTSFIAVQQLVRTNGSTDVDQPLPMPAGVTDQAIGMERGPEPPLWILVGIALCLLGWQVQRRRGAA